ncbi:MAG TPA: hypothetical protein VIT38_13590, partial [Allosphingosinicella sp.]
DDGFGMNRCGKGEKNEREQASDHRAVLGKTDRSNASGAAALTSKKPGAPFGCSGLSIPSLGKAYQKKS